MSDGIDWSRDYDRMLTVSIYARERNASLASAKHAVLQVWPHPLPGQVLRFALGSSSLAILSTRSTYEKLQFATKFSFVVIGQNWSGGTIWRGH